MGAPVLRVVSAALPWIVGVFYMLTASEFVQDDPPLALVAAVVLGAVQGIRCRGGGSGRSWSWRSC